MIILGLHGFSAKSKTKLHNTGVAITKNGKIIAAVDEERYSRIKNDGSFPFKSLEDIYKIANISPKNIDIVAIPDKKPIQQLFLVTKYVFKTFLETGIFMYRYLYKAIKRTFEPKRYMPANLSNAKKIFVEHHIAHAASAYYTCPYNEATIITVDGMGDYAVSGTIGTGIKGKIKILKRLNGFYSPGLFYTIITDYLGFTAGRHEGKITGLAAYGNYKKIYKSISKFISFNHKKNDFYSKVMPYEIDRYSFEYGKKERLYKFNQVFKNESKEDIAASAQKILEDIIVNLIKKSIQKTGIKQLVLAGGVFANVKLNQKIQELDCVNEVYIFPAMSDSGLSVGAALYVEYHILKNKFIPKALSNINFGREYTNEEIQLILEKNKITYKKPANIEYEIAKLISSGKIIAHFNGRMEYGPRALGNRSILAQATNTEINKTLNKRLKRTEFMPFAPAILYEYADKMYKNWHKNNIPSQFMTMTFDVTEEHKKIAPATVHIDGTARPQIVKISENKRFYNIINEYYKLTGIPIIINTSFNIHEEPIVNTPTEALKILRQNSVDILILNDFLIEKQ